MNRRQVGLRLCVTLAIVVVADLAANRLVLADGRFLGRPVAPFDPPLFSGSQGEALARWKEKVGAGGAVESKFDAELGWCNHPNSGFGEYRYDWSGSRIGVSDLPREKVAGMRRLVAVGCSMTHGEEVTAREAWCARLDEKLADWEVANLGVAAYGVDQALLRLRRDGFALEPDEVWLGILPRAALRVTTRFRPLLDHWSLDVAFKPRFVLSEAGLVLEPSPTRTLQDIPRLLESQHAFLEEMGRDTWVARARLAYVPRGSSWVHSSFAGRVFLTAWERSGRSIPDCFDESHPFGQLFTALVEAMAKECSDRGVAFRVVVLPGKDDLEDRRAAGRGYWEDWCARRRDEGIRICDLSAAILVAGDPLSRLFAPQGHYGAEASELVARFLAEEVGR